MEDDRLLISEAQKLYDKGYYSRSLHKLNQERTASNISDNDTLIVMLLLEAKACAKLEDMTKAQTSIQKIKQIQKN